MISRILPAAPNSGGSIGTPAALRALSTAWAVMLIFTSRLAAADAVEAGPVARGDGEAYGSFHRLDHRSSYGAGSFPEPLLIDDSDLELREARVDWLRTSAAGTTTDLVKVEVEQGFGLMTVELEVPHERDSATAVDPVTGKRVTTVTQGTANVSIGARLPLLEIVCADGRVDSTYGAAIEVGVPTHSPVSNSTEAVPKLFADMRLGRHFTLQSIVGYSMIRGGAEDGLHTFEYGFTLGFNINHQDIELPLVLRLIPVVELKGDRALNRGMSPRSSLVGDVGFRANLKTVLGVQPRLGVAWVVPMERGGRRTGFVTSAIFEF